VLTDNWETTAEWTDGRTAGPTTAKYNAFTANFSTPFYVFLTCGVRIFQTSICSRSTYANIGLHKPQASARSSVLMSCWWTFIDLLTYLLYAISVAVAVASGAEIITRGAGARRRSLLAKNNEAEVLFIYIPVIISTPHRGDGCEKGHAGEDCGRAVAASGLMSDDR